MVIKFTQEAIAKGYSFLAGDVHRFPNEIGEIIIADGVAFRVPEDQLNKKAVEALNDAKRRDSHHR